MSRYGTVKLTSEVKKKGIRDFGRGFTFQLLKLFDYACFNITVSWNLLPCWKNVGKCQTTAQTHCVGVKLMTSIDLLELEIEAYSPFDPEWVMG